MPGMPEEFLSALSRDQNAMQRFSALGEEEKDAVVKRAGSALSAQEMEHIVRQI